MRRSSRKLNFLLFVLLPSNPLDPPFTQIVFVDHLVCDTSAVRDRHTLIGFVPGVELKCHDSGEVHCPCSFLIHGT